MTDEAQSGGGLLGSFDNALAGVDPDATPPGGIQRIDADPDVDGEAVEEFGTATAATALDPDVSPWADSGFGGDAPGRPIDPAARRLAERLLGREAPEPSAMLVDPETGVEQQVAGDVVVGRGAGDGDPLAHYSVDLALVSRHHCDIRITADGATIADAGSANGTYLVRGGRTIPVLDGPLEMIDGDIIATADGHRPIARFARPGHGAEA